MSLEKEYKELIDEIARLLQENLMMKKELQGEVKLMKLNEYQDMTARTAPHFDDIVEEITAWGYGIAGESGEVCDLIKKAIWHNHPWNHEKLAYELGDLMYYIARLSNAIGYTLDEVATMNVMKLKKRYPNGFSSEDSLNRRI